MMSSSVCLYVVLVFPPPCMHLHAILLILHESKKGSRHVISQSHLSPTNAGSASPYRVYHPLSRSGNWEGQRAAGSEGGDILDEADVIGIAADGISSDSEEVRGHTAHSHGSRNRTLTLDLWGEAEWERTESWGKESNPLPVHERSSRGKEMGLWHDGWKQAGQCRWEESGCTGRARELGGSSGCGEREKS